MTGDRRPAISGGFNGTAHNDDRCRSHDLSPYAGSVGRPRPPRRSCGGSRRAYGDDRGRLLRRVRDYVQYRYRRPAGPRLAVPPRREGSDRGLSAVFRQHPGGDRRGGAGPGRRRGVDPGAAAARPARAFRRRLRPCRRPDHPPEQLALPRHRRTLRPRRPLGRGAAVPCHPFGKSQPPGIVRHVGAGLRRDARCRGGAAHRACRHAKRRVRGRRSAGRRTLRSPFVAGNDAWQGGRGQ